MAKGMTKGEFMTALAEKAGVSKKEAVELWESLVEMIYSEVKNSEEVTLPGLGKLVKKDRKARVGRNPATGETIQIPAKTVIKFRIAKAAKDSVL